MKNTRAQNVLPRMTLLAGLSLLSLSGGAMGADPYMTTSGGAVNYIPKYSGTTKATKSQIVDNGTSVGIGTAAPGAKLEVAGSGAGVLVNSGATGNPFVKLIGDNASEGANLWYNNSTGDIYLDQLWPYDSTKMHFRMKAAGTAVEPMTLSATGNVGIGTTAPAFKLDVSGTAGIVGRLYSSNTQGTFLQLGNSNSKTAWNLAMGGSNGWSNNNFVIDEHGVAQRLVIVPGGNVGIGTSAPAYKLEVNGVVSGARYQSPTATRQTASIKPLDNPVGRIECLEGISYRAKSARADEDFQLGLVGEDVEACFPELVLTTPEGEKSIDYSRLVVPLIEASKDQQRTIDELEARLARLEATLKAAR